MRIVSFSFKSKAILALGQTDGSQLVLFNLLVPNVNV